MNKLNPMNLKKIIIKYLIIIVALEIIFDTQKLLFPLSMNFLWGGEFFLYPIIRIVIFMGLLQDIFQSKVRFTYAIAAVLIFPIFVQYIQVRLGNIFIYLCPKIVNEGMPAGITNLLNEMENDKCRFPTAFYFSNYYDFLFHIQYFFKTFDPIYIPGIIFAPYILYFFLFFRFCLFWLFSAHNQHPFLSWIPVLNTIRLLRICSLPSLWIVYTLIPVLRLYYFHKINRKLCELENINQTQAIGMTLLPYFFYGKLIFKQDHSF